jgi:hypothetical protein
MFVAAQLEGGRKKGTDFTQVPFQVLALRTFYWGGSPCLEKPFQVFLGRKEGSARRTFAR